MSLIYDYYVISPQRSLYERQHTHMHVQIQQ